MVFTIKDDPEISPVVDIDADTFEPDLICKFLPVIIKLLLS